RRSAEAPAPGRHPGGCPGHSHRGGNTSRLPLPRRQPARTALAIPASPPPKTRHFSLNSRATRGLIYQVVALIALALGIWYLAHNTQANMQARGIQSGFDFLGASAGFDIGETIVAYDPS